MAWSLSAAGLLPSARFKWPPGVAREPGERNDAMMQKTVCLALAAALAAAFIAASTQTTAAPASKPAQPTTMVTYWLEKAEVETARIEDQRGRGFALTRLAVGCCEVGSIDKAKAVLSQRLEDDHRVALSSASFLLTYKGHYDAAIEIANEIKDDYARFNALRDVLAQRGDTDLSGLVKMAEALSFGFESSLALASIAQMQATIGSIDQAKRTMTKMSAGPTTGRDWIGMARTLAERTIRAAEIVHTAQDLRVALAEAETDVKSVHYLVQQAIQQRVRKGKIEAALRLAEQLDDPDQRAKAFLTIADAHVEAGKKDAAREFLAKASANTEKVAAYRERPGATTRPEGSRRIYQTPLWLVLSLNYTHIAKLRAKLGDFDAAKAAIIKAYTSGRTATSPAAGGDNIFGSSRGRSKWIAILIDAGRKDEALALAKGADGKWRPEAQTIIAQLLAAEGETRQVKELLAPITDPKVRAQIMLAAARGAAKRQKALTEQTKPTTQETK